MEQMKGRAKYSEIQIERRITTSQRSWHPGHNGHNLAN